VNYLIKRFTSKYHITVLSYANVGNHLHLHIRLFRHHFWKPFIRGLTAAIAMAITGVSRWQKSKLRKKFWDYRPYTRVVQSWRAFLNMRDYVEINRYEGYGIDRSEAREYVRRGEWLASGSG
jgi:hypothetical protein